MKDKKIIYMSIEKMKDKFIKNELEKGVYAAKNNDGINLVVSIGSDFISIITYQKNGWIRENIYSYDGKNWIEEEIYEGRWDN